MGGIACVTPPGSSNQVRIKRQVKLQSAKVIGSFGQIPIETYNKPAVEALQSFIIEPLKRPEHDATFLRTAVALDNVWVCGYMLHTDPCPSWSGFMKVVMTNNNYERSRIITLSFINLDPSNLSTIYTALHFAQTQCEKYDLRTCPVTFDQPLYMKATKIVASTKSLDKVIVRLGGFHLLTSYLGSIGHIMTESGIAELWETVYAKASIVHMLSGHAYSRALRAHIITSAAVIGVLIDTSNSLDNVDKDCLQKIYISLLRQEQNATTLAEETCILDLNHMIENLLDQAADQSRTGKLWVQYIRQVSLMQHIIQHIMLLFAANKLMTKYV